MASNVRQKSARRKDEDSDCGEDSIVHKSNARVSHGSFRGEIDIIDVDASPAMDKQLLKKQNFKVIRFMFEASIKLRMDSVPLATACALYHRFFRDFSTQDFDQHTVATTCLYLAGKIEEEHVGLTDVINVCHRILFKEEAPLDIGSMYWTLRDSVIQCEMFLTRALKFNLSFNHPHKYLMHYLKSLYDWLDASVTDRMPIARTAWALLRDSYHGDICLSHPPNLIAVSVLYLTLQCYGVNVPYDSDARLHWWQYVGLSGFLSSSAMTTNICPSRRSSMSVNTVAKRMIINYDREIVLLRNSLVWSLRVGTFEKALVDDVNLVKIKKVVHELIEIYDLETTMSV